MAMRKRIPAIDVTFVIDPAGADVAEARRAITELARALARMAALEDDARENEVQ